MDMLAAGNARLPYRARRMYTVIPVAICFFIRFSFGPEYHPSTRAIRHDDAKKCGGGGGTPLPTKWYDGLEVFCVDDNSPCPFLVRKSKKSKKKNTTTAGLLCRFLPHMRTAKLYCEYIPCKLVIGTYFAPKGGGVSLCTHGLLDAQYAHLQTRVLSLLFFSSRRPFLHAHTFWRCFASLQSHHKSIDVHCRQREQDV